MQRLAQDYVVVAESPDKGRHFAGSPGITRLPGGEMVASCEWFQPKPYTETLANQTEVRVSADGGRTWELRGRTDIIWPSCFVHAGALYMIGNRRQSRGGGHQPIGGRRPYLDAGGRGVRPAQLRRADGGDVFRAGRSIAPSRPARGWAAAAAGAPPRSRS